MPCYIPYDVEGVGKVLQQNNQDVTSVHQKICHHYSLRDAERCIFWCKIYVKYLIKRDYPVKVYHNEACVCVCLYLWGIQR